MRGDVVLITNNPGLQQSIVSSGLAFVAGTSLNVLTAARDAVHLGGFLLTHPLYGNLRPNQQPFRSVLIQKGTTFDFNSAACLESLSMIEEAVLLYQGYGNRLPRGDGLPEAARHDYAFVDFELMRESLTLYGLLPKGSRAEI
jgi:hypothetical protein